MKIFQKIKMPNGRNKIYFCGLKIFSYKSHYIADPIEHIRSLGVKVGKNFLPVIHPHPWSYPDFGSEPYLIEIGDDVCISFGCTFLTHDAAILVCKKLLPNKDCSLFKLGKIKIGNNCFIGCNCTILPNVTIGDNCIIGAGSVITKNIPSGEVWAGNPAHFITTTEKLAKKIAKNCQSNFQQKLLQEKHFFEQHLLEKKSNKKRSSK